jgi:hypothetical protein
VLVISTAIDGENRVGFPALTFSQYCLKVIAVETDTEAYQRLCGGIVGSKAVNKFTTIEAHFTFSSIDELALENLCFIYLNVNEWENVLVKATKTLTVQHPNVLLCLAKPLSVQEKINIQIFLDKIKYNFIGIKNYPNCLFLQPAIRSINDF